MAAHRSIDRQTFLVYLRQSGLLDEDQLGALAQRVSERGSGRSLARALVAEGVLTRFQAERLLMGRTSGFLLGQYRILEQIGRGGMGRVYRAEHRTMKRVVALKVLTAELLNTERAVELFLHEVRAVSQLVHPNIVTAFDANEISGRYYLVMEHVDGPNLDQLVRRQGVLSVGLACDYIRQAANGLQCAHLLGMVHRDIKPANILVQWHGLNGASSPGLVKISDFGLARLAAPQAGQKTAHLGHQTILTRDNTVMGTPDYLSPEQSRNLHRTDIRSDLYSLGCTFYFLLTGSVPYPGGTPLDKMIRHATESPTPVARLRPDVPAAVAAIVEKLMARVPEDRFQTPGELADALQPYATSGPTPWAPSRLSSSRPYVDSLATPAEDLSDEAPDDPGDDIVPDGSDGELSALSNTLSADQSPTPIAPSQQVRRPQRPGPVLGHLQLALIIAVSLVGGLIGLAVAAALLLGK
jgi:serine/threonine-protein kinase